MTDNLPPLLPCPFCGNEKNIAMANEKHNHSGGYFIACPACDASTGLRYACGEDPRPLLVEQWNRRAALAQAQSCVPTLWAIHVPGPDDYYPAPSEEAANHMVSKHNAAMTEWFKANPDTSGNRPPIESSLASAQRWPGSAADHAEEIAVFDYAAWGLASPQPQPVQPSGTILDCDVEPRPLAYSLKDYHHSITDGPLHFTWQDKPHRIVYDLIAAVRFYAQAKPEQAAQWQKRHPEQYDGAWVNTNEGDAKWWRDYSKGWEIRVLYAHPVAQAKPEQAAQPTQAAIDVLAERQRQISVEGWTPEHDDEHDCSEMADAAACYAANAGGVVVWADVVPAFWPWAPEWWRPSTPRNDLIKAGALILAEIERLDRAAAPQPKD